MSITLIATGGTIASTKGDDGVVTTTRSGGDLVSDLASSDELDVVELPVAGSWNMSGQHALRIARTAVEALERGAEGVVVTHGTDVLEETAYLTELIGRSATTRGPIVFTAAMRNASELGADGPRNLADALSVARDPSAAGKGVLVCLNGELHHARWVTKTDANSLLAFSSPGAAPVGKVGTLGARFVLDPPPPPPAPPEAPRLDARVPIVVSHWDADDELVPWLLSRGARGIVVEAGGAGNVNQCLLRGLEEALDAGVPVVVASRCRGGRVEPVYGGAGGFATLAERGAVPSWGLTAGKARLALQVALDVDPDPAAVRTYFDGLADER